MLDFLIDFSSQFSWIGYLIEISLLILAAVFLRGLGMRWLRERLREKPAATQELLLVVLDKALVPVLLLAVVAASLNLFPLPLRLLYILNRCIYAAFLISLLYYASQASQILLNHWLSRNAGSEAIRGQSRMLVRSVFLVIGVMLVLENLGISLTALWTTLGVGSVAIALALQDTLTNFFGGIYLQLDRPVRLGDYVKVGTGEEGFVTQMGWRSTRIRTLANNIVIIPNSKLATQNITNFSLPEQEMSLNIPINVGYDSDPDEIERILVDEATSRPGEIPALRQDPPPFVRFIPGFGESALNFTLTCRVASYVDQYFVQHELRKRILARFHRDGIAMPFPQHEVHLHTSAPRPSSSASAAPADAAGSSQSG
jgi:small-conductance mechanosensitive channel